ncbi:mechanosensitive ion channel protein MscS [Sorangium cellulosum]|jgi:small conductance mechanosensitive channel|uniref:Mechanosensitive ion channel protein MscS n=1 Tax=Sorangium cellulosum TaxID=56 RepID=A0A4V0ND65_SORCE|nr:mechanosensitive ion channel family protein [Sorangium cellulosum]AUX21592.1 mechanosensitive ion channel protein MscS [Sorangium cellulosum]
MPQIDSWLNSTSWQEVARRTAEWAIHALPAVLLILVLALVLLKALRFLCRRMEVSLMRRARCGDAKTVREIEKHSEALLHLFRTSGRVVIGITVSLLLLGQIGVDVAPLLVAVGVAGLTVGLGAQELVRDVISGFFLLLESHVRVGDVVIVDGTGGLVEHIGLRTLTLRDESGVVHIFQNGKIGSLANTTREWSAMVFDVGVATREDVDKVMRVMREVAHELEEDRRYKANIVEPPEVLGVESFDDRAVIVRARIKTQPAEQWQIGREYRRRLKKAFDAHGIEMPSPHRRLSWGEASPPVKVNVRASSGVSDRANGARMDEAGVQA